MAAPAEDGDCTSSVSPASCCSVVSKSWYQPQCSRFTGTHSAWAKIFSIKQGFTPKEASTWITVPALLPHSSATVALAGDKSLRQAVN